MESGLEEGDMVIFMCVNVSAVYGDRSQPEGTLGSLVLAFPRLQSAHLPAQDGCGMVSVGRERKELVLG